MDPKVGDVVHVKCVVTRVSQKNDLVVIIYPTSNIEMWVAPNDIVHIERPPLKVGENVRHQSVDWSVIGLRDEMVWICRGDRYLSLHRDEVQRYS